MFAPATSARRAPLRASAQLRPEHDTRRHHAGNRAAGARKIWELGQMEVIDGGPDGDVDTPGNAVFARQGVFIP